MDKATSKCGLQLHAFTSSKWSIGTFQRRKFHQCLVFYQIPEAKLTLIEMTKILSMALARKRTIPTKQPPLVGEVSANFCRWMMSRGQRNRFPRPLISVF
jgi:hypothetical protein